MKQKIALALGSGGARGIAHIGVIRELQKQGYEISSVSGTSMGALVGGIFCSGKLDEFEEWLLDLDRMNVFHLMDFTLSKSGLLKANKALAEIKKFIPDQNIENLEIPFTAIATNIKTKEEEVLSTGSLWDAIRASIAIPMAITPAKIDDGRFVDGGVLNPVPTNRVKRTDGDLLVAVNVTAKAPVHPSLIEKKKEIEPQNTNKLIKTFKERLDQITPTFHNDNPGYFQLINETVGLMLAQISKLTLEIYPPDLLIELSRETCSTFEFHKAKELIEVGRLLTSEILEKNSFKNE